MLFTVCSVDKHQPKLQKLACLDMLKLNISLMTCGGPANSQLQNHLEASGHVCDLNGLR